MSERLAAWETEGAGAAALVAAGVGSLVFGVLTAVADHVPHVKSSLIWVKATGPLSGVTMASVAVWLLVWVVLHALWSGRVVAIRKAGWVAVLLLLVGFLLTFPPLIDRL